MIHFFLFFSTRKRKLVPDLLYIDLRREGISFWWTAWSLKVKMNRLPFWHAIWYSGILAPTWNRLYLPRIVYRIVINNCVSSHLIDSFRLHYLPIYFHESRGLYFPFNYSLIELNCCMEYLMPVLSWSVLDAWLDVLIYFVFCLLVICFHMQCNPAVNECINMSNRWRESFSWEITNKRNKHAVASCCCCIKMIW